MAVAALFLAAGVVYLGRSGYRHVNGTELTFVDAFYYATVSLSTTGYGDISPITPRARLTNIVVITPLRVVFLVLLVGTTLSALTETSRQITRIKRWRRRASGHTVVVGYGTKGRAAVDAVLAANRRAKVAVVDSHPPALEAASARELTTIAGSGSQRGVLAAAAVDRAESIIVAVDRDDACVLVTLTARQLAPSARIVAAVRSSSSVKILKQCGADTVVVSQETAGRLLGVATSSPTVVEAFEHLLSHERGAFITERAISAHEHGRSPIDCEKHVLGVVREGALHRLGRSTDDRLAPGDRLLYLRSDQG
ncbi:potassium channel family protein [Rhodococcus sp. I2R]|nr:potassium channel family protein [Rhodococcus sp. I2R]